MQKPLNILETSWRNQPTINVDEVRNIPFQLKPIIINDSEIGSKVGVYALDTPAEVGWNGMLVNVKSRTETSISVDIYSKRDETVNNVFYRYKSDKIEETSGIPSSELETLVSDIFHDYLGVQGVENFDIFINPDVVPTTVDYLINTL